MKIKNILLGTDCWLFVPMWNWLAVTNDFLEEKSYEYTSSTSYNTPEELDMAIGFLHGASSICFLVLWGIITIYDRHGTGHLCCNRPKLYYK